MFFLSQVEEGATEGRIDPEPEEAIEDREREGHDQGHCARDWRVVVDVLDAVVGRERGHVQEGEDQDLGPIALDRSY